MSEILRNKTKSKKTTYGNGKEAYIYTHGYVSNVCHGVKEHNEDCIFEMAEFLALQIDEDCILVPAPQHTGKAEYTLEICEIIKEVSDYDILILDVLNCSPRDTLYNIKKQFQAGTGRKFTPEELAKISSGLFLKEDLKDIDLPIYFVDNVISTGTTLRDAQKLIPNIEPLVFAISRAYVRS